VVLHQHL